MTEERLNNKIHNLKVDVGNLNTEVTDLKVQVSTLQETAENMVDRIQHYKNIAEDYRVDLAMAETEASHCCKGE